MWDSKLCACTPGKYNSGSGAVCLDSLNAAQVLLQARFNSVQVLMDELDSCAVGGWLGTRWQVCSALARVKYRDNVKVMQELEELLL